MFAIRLRSKHTGQETWLGMKHADYRAACEWAKSEVCERCNYVDFIPVAPEAVWQGRDIGFRRT